MRLLSMLFICLLVSCSSASEPDNTPNPLCAAMPEGTEGTVRISGLVPNPEGADNYREMFFIRNYSSTTTVSLVGWVIKNKETTNTAEWKLDSLVALNPCEEKLLISNKGAQLLNSGDTVKLYDNNGTFIQMAGYGANVKEGDTVRVK